VGPHHLRAMAYVLSAKQCSHELVPILLQPKQFLLDQLIAHRRMKLLLHCRSVLLYDALFPQSHIQCLSHLNRLFRKI
jgi:hypothetical protein